MNCFKISNITAFFLTCSIVNFAYAVPPVNLEYGDVHAQVNTVNEVDTKIEQLRIILNNRIDQVLDIAKDHNIQNTFKNIFPVGSVYITFANQTPPLHQEYGITWEVLPENCAIMTGNSHNTGQRSGNNILDTGTTKGHALTIDQMPAHTHGYIQNYSGQGQRTKNGTDYDAAIGQTQSTGGNQAHTHELNIYNQKLLFWKRTS